MQVGVDSEGVAGALGVNNAFVKRVAFSFGQADYQRTVLSLSADGEERFDIPEPIVPKLTPKEQYRLDMANFQFDDTPFSFSFASPRTGEKLIDSFNQTFVVQDKFVQVDMVIPTGHVYGFGEREAGFELGQGAWTMWSQA